MITANDIQKIIDDNREDLEIPNRIASALERFEGKKVTKRIENALNKEIPLCKFHLESVGGMIYLRVNTEDNQYPLGFLLGYGSNVIFNLKRFKENYNKAYFGSAERRNQERDEIKKETLEELAEKINLFKEIEREIQNLLKDMPDKYEIEELMEK